MTPDFSIGTVSTLPAGSSATASITGTTEEPVLNLGIPQGQQGETGATPNLTIGTVTTLPAGSDATATISGTAENPVLSLGIPKGDTGEVSQADLAAALLDKADVITDTASGAIASFPDGMAAPALDVTIDIEAVQAGSGDPSPYNIRPITGWTEANIYVEDTYDEQATPEVTIQLGQTVYGGTLDVTEGKLIIDKSVIDLGDLTYTYDATYTRFTSSKIPNIKESGAGSRSTYLLSSMFLGIYDGRGIALVPDNSVYCGGNSEKVIYIKTSLYTDKDLFKSFVTGQQLVYPIAPVSVQLAPTDVQILLHDNNIWSDTGNTEVTYRADTKQYILKKIAEALNA